MFKRISIFICILALLVFFITNCETYTKAEVDALINGLDDDISDQEQPLAFGTINSVGLNLGGSGNYTSELTSTGVYTITVTGYDCYYEDISVFIGLSSSSAGFYLGNSK